MIVFQTNWGWSYETLWPTPKDTKSCQRKATFWQLFEDQRSIEWEFLMFTWAIIGRLVLSTPDSQFTNNCGENFSDHFMPLMNNYTSTKSSTIIILQIVRSSQIEWLVIIHVKSRKISFELRSMKPEVEPPPLLWTPLWQHNGDSCQCSPTKRTILRECRTECVMTTV